MNTTGNQPEPAAQAAAEPASPYLSVLKRLRGVAYGVSLYGAPDKDLLARRIDGIADELAAYGATLIAEDAGVEPASVRVPLSVLEAASKSLGAFVSDDGWSLRDMQTMDNLDAYIARHKANHHITGQAEGE